ncbi:transposase family protein [Streptomyces fagopyri]|uniref:transposase family protein n=1 Tax=Streptomyces fagopyri TaxID=2662397 RepID=UPI0037FAB5E1
MPCAYAPVRRPAIREARPPAPGTPGGTAADLDDIPFCPDRGARTRRSKSRRVTRPRDLPAGGLRPRLVWARRRWRCDDPACGRRSRQPSATHP